MSRHENSNQFKDGLLMDLHPLQTPNTVLTDNLNGTFITYNGNEYSLQNDMGNFKLKNCKLESKYFPIGTTSYADTIYIVSYNPVDKLVQIGSYPSPVQYNETPIGNSCKFYSITESVINQEFETGSKLKSGDYITLDSQKIEEFTSKYKFEGDLFRLKSGDEYVLNYDQKAYNYFEDIVTSVIFDSGKSQIINPKWNPSGYLPVPWNTPGHLEITSKMVDFDKCEIDLVGEFYKKTECVSTFKVDLYISDDSFVEKIKNAGNSIFMKDNKDEHENKDEDEGETTSTKGIEKCIWIDTDISDSTATYDIRFNGCSKWMSDYLKIQFLINVKNKFPDNEPEYKSTFNLKVIPYVTSKTYFTAEGSDENASNLKFYIRTEYTSKSAEINHTVDTSKSPFNNIADKILQWNDTTVSFNGNGFEESVGKMQCALYDCSFNKIETNDIDWCDLSYNDSIYTYTFGSKDNGIYYLFIRPLAVKYDGDSPVQNDEGGYVYDEDNYDIIKRVVMIINDFQWNTYFGDDRYDQIPLQSVVSKYFEDKDAITNPDILFDSPKSRGSIEFGLIDDFKNPALESNFKKYFKRFNNNELEFKSFVKKGEVPESLETLYTNKSYSYTPEYTSTSTNSLFSNFEQKVRCDNGIENPFFVSNQIKVFAGFMANIITGKTFLFADNLQYYRIKALPLDNNGRFFTANIDKDGKKDNNFFISVLLGDAWPEYKSLDINNYRSIRMYYPPYHGNRSTYNTNGMCQMDFFYLGTREINGLCQYVKNFHYNLTNKLKNFWLNEREYHTITVELTAKTFYSDKAQRASFANDSFTINISPDWNKFDDERGPGWVDDNDDKGVSTSQLFLAFPICTVDQNNNVVPKKLAHHLDKEYWWKVSGSEQHNEPEIFGEGEVEGIGLIKCNEAYENRRLYAAWVPNEPNAKFVEYAYGTINMDNSFTDIPDIRLDLIRIPDKDFKDLCNKIKTDYPSEFDVPLLDTEFTDAIVWSQTYNVADLNIWDISELDTLKNNFNEIAADDEARLKEHPIFKFTIVPLPESRIQSSPIAGVYPDTVLTTNVFGPAGFNMWSHFKVDNEGRVYLYNLDVNDDIYIRKNSNKKVFGYFPYLPYCEQWI